MRIGLLLPSLLNTTKFSDRIFAPGELFTDLVRGLAARGHEVTAYSSVSGIPRVRVVRGAREFEERLMPGTRDYGKGNPAVHRFFVEARNRSEYEIEFLSRAIADANARGLDILHVYFGSLAHYFVPYARMPVVFTIHDPVFKKHTLEYWRFKHFRNHNYFLISRSQEREYVSAFRFPNREVILHGVHIEKFPFVPRSREHLVLIGRYMAQKGFVEAMRIAQDLRKEIYIASSPNYREFPYYKTKMRPLLRSPYIVERGHLSVSGRNKYVGSAKAFLFPLKWPEPFGMVTIEAMALGTPVIAFAEGALPEIIKDGETGFLVKRLAGIAGLKKAVSRMYAMPPKEYEAMRRACRAHVETHFSTARMTKDHERAYRRFVSARI
ncbi:MAG: glycosyltransferase [Candidatus Wolfebacteria bacterium]|nr:glycosyltransferase [Candidatus Wolfebacteria bacterium]MDP2703870.1 glycosyltransferase [bacterium]